MKNITLTALAILPFFVSCSTDPDRPAPADNVKRVETAKLAQEVNFTNQTFALTYNPDHTLDSAISDNGYYLLSYENGRISNVSGEMEDQAFDVDFTYSGNMIAGVTVNGVAKVITYDPVQKAYEVRDTAESLAKVTYFLNGDADLKEVQSFGNQGNFIDGKIYYYDDMQKGPLFNANRVTVQLAIACKKQALYSCAFGGFRPFKHFAGAHNGPMIMNNTFDAEGYVIDSDDNEQNFATFSYANL
ncbi:hypothetical protein [Flavobacterium caeni]|uniref:Uncharacterized protein n=1 Tax=Flavobacterium caeni TaxID=490189 RepID=A0A1G5AT17_9FLAO|nr:hypothetical protein [Flavobacterium caeni]SCX80940.1 hypothetical protein SAMN02927903_00138 [Flavobacterium caeni]